MDGYDCTSQHERFGLDHSRQRRDPAKQVQFNYRAGSPLDAGPAEGSTAMAPILEEFLAALFAVKE